MSKSKETLMSLQVGEVSEDVAKHFLKAEDTAVWRVRPPTSPEWPAGYWSHLISPLDATDSDIEIYINSKYGGDWSPDRVQWTIEKVVGRMPNPRGKNLSRRQKAAIRHRAAHGLHLFEEDRDEPRTTSARPGPVLRGAPLSDIPEGTPIRRLPPGGADGAMPFDWGNPTMSVVANKSGSKLRRPKLIDAAKMHDQFPATFQLPSKEAVRRLGPGDFAKVSTKTDRFWVRVIKHKGSKFEGIVDSNLVGTPGLHLGDRIAFESRHVHDVR